MFPYNVLTANTFSKTVMIVLAAMITLLSFEKTTNASVIASVPDIVVDTTSDAEDFGGSQQVDDLPGPDGVVSLHEAITAANNTPGPQVIWFNIPTTDSGFDGKIFKIEPYSPLPSLLDNGTTIDGCSQTDFTGDTNLFGPEVVLDGSKTEEVCVGIGIDRSDNHIIRSLVIHSFKATGIQFFEDPPDFGHPNNVEITQCYIGTDETGSTGKGNGWQGIVINGSDNVIGGANPEDGNLISNNNGSEIGIGGYEAVSSNTLVQGNMIGTDRTGMVALGKTVGVALCNAKDCLVKGNLISGNEIGVMFDGSSAEGNCIEENLIGTDVTGEGPLPNNEQGVYFPFSSNSNIVIGNRIAFNHNCGIIVGSDSTQNTISNNSIFSNDGLGIDLGFDGITYNDINDADSGANNLQNFPVLTWTNAGPGRLIVKGTIDTPSPRTVTVEFFANPVPDPGADPSEYGEGAMYLGSDRPNSKGKFTATLPTVPPGTLISATATDAYGNTSEFSANIEAQHRGH
jgi:hypothetical protein